MSAVFGTLQMLVASGDWRVSDHAYDRITRRGLIASRIADGLASGTAIEDYPHYHAGPCVLVFQSDGQGAVHALWGLEQGTTRPAVLITAYKPDPAKRDSDNRTRR